MITNCSDGYWMMDMPLISVIVPIYNAEKTITECLGNLLHQTIFPQMELLLIDDASIDRTTQILTDCRAQFGEQIRIYRYRENQGPGAARNVGLREARGKYIGFVDADDLIDLTMYEKLLREAERTSADFTDCGFYQQRLDKAFLFTSQEICDAFPSPRARSVLIAEGGFTVTKLFRREFLLSHEIFFRPVYGLEDMDYLMLAILHAEKIACVPEMLYIYRDQTGSLVRNEQHERNFYQCAAAMGAIYERMHEHERYGEIQNAAEYTMLELYARCISRALHLALEYPGGTGKDKALKLLHDAREVRRLCVTGSIQANEFSSGLSEESKALIRDNDKNPEALLKTTLKRKK